MKRLKNTFDTNAKKFFKIFFIFTVSVNFYCLEAVEHKNPFLNLYLDLIRYNTQEKLGILPYIQEINEGTFLEIGTGGDPLGELIDKIDNNKKITIIAADIDKDILSSLVIRHPRLQSFLEKEGEGIKLILKQLDATSMKEIEDEALNGINASALLHEIFSYSGGETGLKNFITESLRVLKSEGVLVYRDPEGVKNKYKPVKIVCKTKQFKLFAHIFLPKFLDRKYGILSKNNRKFHLYDPTSTTITFYRKNQNHHQSVSVENYLSTKSYEIDFSRTYKIKMPYGLYRELERHYLTYLHQCNPLAYVKCIPQVGSLNWFINYYAHSTPMVLEKFLKKNELTINDCSIDHATKKKIDQEIEHLGEILEYGIVLTLPSKNKIDQLFKTIENLELTPEDYIIPIKNNAYLVDYRIYGLLYDYFTSVIFDHQNKPLHLKDVSHAQWLSREGEETYIYYNADELIAKFIQYSLKKTEKDPYVLCPLSKDHNFFIPRLCYEEILKNSVTITDQIGTEIEPREGKRIIHFQKMRLSKALKVLDTIVAENDEAWPHIKQCIKNIKTMDFHEA